MCNTALIEWKQDMSQKIFTIVIESFWVDSGGTIPPLFVHALFGRPVDS